MTKKKVEVEDILNNDSVVNADGTKYVPTKLEKLNDWLWDNSFIYRFLYRLWTRFLSPSVNYYRLRRLCGRIKWGFDISETWSLDWTFYKWIYPRLKRFEIVTQAYPMNTTFEGWKTELQKRVEQLDLILHVDEFDFNDWSYIPEKELEELKEKLKNDGSWEMTVNATAYEYCKNDFNKWFCENLNQLWW